MSLRFDEALQMAPGVTEASGFELVGADGAWKAAEAKVEGDRVQLRAAGLPYPVAVRYAWSDAPEPSLMDTEGRWAQPFLNER